ncbi:VIT family protein [Aeromicrobium camelliae]|uniref:VIT family protein n=1 Tax=Aeromicrobium camelliae TaxID=1538144 RepID=A0A3N6WPK7_9ACTN|nr:VIT family protein [Aeromicrobium camelliae]RQN03293.1 VIT family protein [Aeromicrobium camelliae]
MAEATPPPHEGEAHGRGLAQRLNWLRAGVLGANDGIVSVAAVVVGVASATDTTSAILTAGIAALVGGAISMALGEYVSVSSQRDTERALIDKERGELEAFPAQELEELTQLLVMRGLSPVTARQVAAELTEHDPLEAHLAVELGIDRDDLINPWHAAVSSAVAFTLGAILPMLAVTLPPAYWRIPATFIAVLAALAITGVASATLGGSSRARAAARLVVGGFLALAATYVVGGLLGTAGVV